MRHLSYETMKHEMVFHINLIIDRDNYITVNYDNIQQSGWSQYKKCEGTECLTFGAPYDCDSIMHYRDYFFVKASGLKTMTAKDPSSCSLSGYNTQLTGPDITLLKVKYYIPYLIHLSVCP